MHPLEPAEQLFPAGAAVTWLISTRVSPGKLRKLCKVLKVTHTHTHKVTQRTQTGLFSLGVADLSKAGDEFQQLMAGLLAFN